MTSILNKRFVLIATIILVLFSNNVSAQLQPAFADSLLNFIKMNKERASIYITKNDTIIAFLNENKLMPLASTFKILVAIEFAKQASAGIIEKNAYVPLSEMDKYYLPNTDEDAHPQWLDHERKSNHIKNDSVQLINVARGMMMFNSNANTEYLMDLLGINNVRSNIGLFGLRIHTSIYPPPASLLMYQNPKAISEDKILKAIGKIQDENYSKHVYALHVQLKHDFRFKAAFRSTDLTMKMQKAWSNRLPASTTKDYVHLANILNNRKFLSDSAYKVLGEIVEYLMENKNLQSVFKHYGASGGNTNFTLSHVFYLQTTSNTKIELAVFFNDLAPAEEKKLAVWFAPFEAQVIFDGAFRGKLRF